MPITGTILQETTSALITIIDVDEYERLSQHYTELYARAALFPLSRSAHISTLSQSLFIPNSLYDDTPHFCTDANDA